MKNTTNFFDELITYYKFSNESNYEKRKYSDIREIEGIRRIFIHLNSSIVVELN